jgi:hypothetical protein
VEELVRSSTFFEKYSCGQTNGSAATVAASPCCAHRSSREMIGPLEDGQRYRGRKLWAERSAGDLSHLPPFRPDGHPCLLACLKLQSDQTAGNFVVGHLAGEDLLTRVTAFVFRTAPRQPSFQRAVLFCQFSPGAGRPSSIRRAV